jgi:hypothetical protein
MAVITGTRTSYVDRPSVKENIDDRLDFLTPTDLPLLSTVGFMKEAAGATAGANTLKFPCTQTRHTWLNDDLVPSVATLNSTYTASSSTSIDVGSGEGARFDVDDVVMIGETYFLVTAVSTDTLTISVLAGDANHSSGEVVYLIGNARTESVLASSLQSRTTDFGSTENFTQIFAEVVRISGTEAATERWGIAGDPYEYQLNKVLRELAIQLERDAIYGRRNTSYPSSNSTARRMGGLAEFIRDTSGANVRDAGGADLDEILLNRLLQDIWEDGGSPDIVMVGGRQKVMISGFLNPYVRVDRTETTAGVIVGTYVSDFGELQVVLNRWMKPDDLIILTSEYIGIGPLTGNGDSRAFAAEPLPKDGDRIQTLIVGEYTMEVRNNTKAHGWLKNLSTS